MGYARLAIYVIGLMIVVMAAWIFLTQTPLGETIPAGVALAMILLLVGIGVMAAARSIDDTFYSRRRVVRDDGVGANVAPGYVAPGYVAPGTVVNPPTTYDTTRETVIEERRF